jgi:hypothetical protein
MKRYTYKQFGHLSFGNIFGFLGDDRIYQKLTSTLYIEVNVVDKKYKSKVVSPKRILNLKFPVISNPYP